MNYSAMGLLLCVSSTVLFVSGAWADIRDTKHNFTGSTKGKRAADREVCAFCHTPALATGSGERLVTPPAWQHSVGTDLVFTIYDDIGRLGVGRPSIGSQSIACLSCHDSNQAMAVNLTSFDHPFGIPYRGFLNMRPSVAGLRTLSQNSNSDGAPSSVGTGMAVADDFRSVSSGTIDGRGVWWVSPSGITARRGKNDLPLYVRSLEGETDDGVPYIECSSCHDPHSVNETFLRVENHESRLCFTCHSK